jgi:hypothetical protein
LLCPYRWVFETPHPAGVPHLHNLQDVPRPFVIQPPRDQQQRFEAGATLEFGLVLIGRGIDFLPYFLLGFEHLGALGLGRDQARARLERVEALTPFQPVGLPIYQDGRVIETANLPLLNTAELPVHAATLPADLHLELRTPVRVKAQGHFLTELDLGALVQAACWRMGALAAFHGARLWPLDYRPVVAQARAVRVERAAVQWVDWERTSTRGGARRQMSLGGIVGTATLRTVPPEVRAALLAASVLHVGKACVFGHGSLHLAPL